MPLQQPSQNLVFRVLGDFIQLAYSDDYSFKEDVSFALFNVVALSPPINLDGCKTTTSYPASPITHNEEEDEDEDEEEEKEEEHREEEEEEEEDEEKEEEDDSSSSQDDNDDDE